MGVWPQPCRGEAWWGEEDMVSGVAPGFARTQLCVETEVLQRSAPTIQLPEPHCEHAYRQLHRHAGIPWWLRQATAYKQDADKGLPAVP